MTYLLLCMWFHRWLKYTQKWVYVNDHLHGETRYDPRRVVDNINLTDSAWYYIFYHYKSHRAFISIQLCLLLLIIGVCLYFKFYRNIMRSLVDKQIKPHNISYLETFIGHRIRMQRCRTLFFPDHILTTCIYITLHFNPAGGKIVI